MNFPLDNPFYQFIYQLLNTAGIGGLIVAAEAFFIIIAVALSLRSIVLGARADELETYAYPTPALHQHGRDD
ncbi:MAG: hypothetical protein GXP38_10220 [Chloroflexi bacterium]|nr:hypothetical protein [Chloroflexota bacterium]